MRIKLDLFGLVVYIANKFIIYARMIFFPLAAHISGWSHNVFNYNNFFCFQSPMFLWNVI